jgi:hypothetical protein
VDANAEPKAAEVEEKPKLENPGFKKRIDKLTARAKQAEEQAQKMELEVERYKRAFTLLQEQYASKESRLSELEDVDPMAAENERLKFEDKVRKAQQELDTQFKAKVQEAERNARIQSMAEQIVEEVEAATAKYPTVSTVELAMAIRQNPNASVEEVAKGLHLQRYKALEQEFTSKFKDRTNAPKPVSQNGSAAKRVIQTDTDLSDELDAMLGPDWHQRR